MYAITAYGDLIPLLGPRWHIRGVNCSDFCYVNLEMALFHLHHLKGLEDFDIQSGESSTEYAGSTLVFKFVRMDGTQTQYDTILRLQ